MDFYVVHNSIASMMVMIVMMMMMMMVTLLDDRRYTSSICEYSGKNQHLDQNRLTVVLRRMSCASNFKQHNTNIYATDIADEVAMSAVVAVDVSDCFRDRKTLTLFLFATQSKRCGHAAIDGRTVCRFFPLSLRRLIR